MTRATTPTVLPVPGSRAAAPEVLQWLAPAPLWTSGAAAGAPARPWIAELTSDAFLPELLDLLAGANGASPADLALTRPARTVDGDADGPYRLFQPLSQRYYVVTASLVCRRPGIPDHAVRPARGERATFVIRRLTPAGDEEAWVPGSGAAPPGAAPSGSWLPAVGDDLVPGEEELPLHAAPVGAFAEAGSVPAALGMRRGTASTRSVLHGYIPVGRRERMIPAMPDDEVLRRLDDYNRTRGPLPAADPVADELLARVVTPWQALRTAPAPVAATYPSLYLALDLADWLRTYVPSVWASIAQGDVLPVGDARRTLLDQLASITVPTTTGSTQALTAVLADVGQDRYRPLLQGADIAGPGTGYDLRATSLPQPDYVSSLTAAVGLYRSALAARDKEPNPPPPRVPPELSGMIKDDPAYVPAGRPQQAYVIRTAFHHEPCRTVLSARSHPFALARATDGDAPARRIRVQVPDVSNMRSFQRGVSLELPPSLQRLLNRVTPGMLKGDPLDAGPDVALGMICSFSIQIIFICAFVVLFIFLLLLNIVFWWLPFLKICYPIPVRPPTPNAPSP